MNQELSRLGDDYWEYRLQVNPTTALMMGDHRYDGQMEDASRAAEDAHIARLRSSPIVNFWVVVDRAPFTDTPFLGMVNGPIHWLFNRSLIDGESGGETLLNCTISAARSAVADSPESLQELFRGEMARYFPDHEYKILHFRVIKEKRATISHAAGTYQWRPEIVAPIGGLYMAGDWVRTGLPATIESAVQSGHESAAAVLARRA